jgi:hypothetical protein
VLPYNRVRIKEGASALSSSLFARALIALAAAAAISAAFADTPDYEFTPLSKNAASAKRPFPKFRFMFGEPSRWPSSRIPWRYNHANAPSGFASDAAATVAQIRTALDTWTAVCGIRYVYEGETTVAPNTTVAHPSFGPQPDYVNVVGWGSLDGDTAGLAHLWYDDESRELVDGDIILSITRIDSLAAMERTAAHEWGHAIGIAHSNVFGALMSGPPESQYNSLRAVQNDDIRGCRCLYGAAAGSPAGFSCSLPTRVDFGGVPINSASAPRQVPFTNSGNAPLTVNGVTTTNLVVAVDGGCPANTVLAPGQSCTVTVVARPTVQFAYDELLAFATSDGVYNVPVKFVGTPGAAAPTVVQLVEYFHAGFGHYFVTHLTDEIAKLDDGRIAGWTRTGRTLRAWALATGGSSPVCRFFSEQFTPKSSHFYTSFAVECQTVKGNRDWTFEGEVFHVGLPDAQGACAAGTQPVFRLYNDGQSGAPNHRFTTDAALRTQLLGQGWVAEGAGPGVTMCSPL